MTIISRDKKIKNLTLATVHAMMESSLAPATGTLVSEIIAKNDLCLYRNVSILSLWDTNPRLLIYSSKTENVFQQK